MDAPCGGGQSNVTTPPLPPHCFHAWALSICVPVSPLPFSVCVALLFRNLRDRPRAPRTELFTAEEAAKNVGQAGQEELVLSRW